MHNYILYLFTQRARALKYTKEKGNEAFKSGEHQEAYDLYSQALLIDPLNTSTNAKLHFNRATVSSKVCPILCDPYKFITNFNMHYLSFFYFFK